MDDVTRQMTEAGEQFAAACEELARASEQMADAFRALFASLPPDLALTAYDDDEGA